MTTDGSTPETIAGHAPSRKAVYLSLHDAGPATPSELADRLDLPQRTVTRCLHELVQTDAVTHDPAQTDARRDVYRTR